MPPSTLYALLLLLQGAPRLGPLGMEVVPMNIEVPPMRDTRHLTYLEDATLKQVHPVPTPGVAEIAVQNLLQLCTFSLAPRPAAAAGREAGVSEGG